MSVYVHLYDTPRRPVVLGPFRYVGVETGVSGLSSARAFDQDDHEIARLAGGKWRAVHMGEPDDAFYNHMDVDTEPTPQRKRDEEAL